MYKIIVTCFVFCFYTNLVYAESCLSSQEVQESLNRIQQLPEAREMMQAIQKEGPIRIAISDNAVSKQFGACWDVEQRVILIYPPFHYSMGQIIGSILFEMHNARTHSQILHYDALAIEGKIDREAYIRSIEHMEYVNSKNTAAMVDAGIARGIFPPESKRNTYRDFEEHYYYQQYGGHSAWIGRSYDHLAPSGTS